MTREAGLFLMRPARDEASFLRSPVGSFFGVGSGLIWCHSPTLCGAASWGRPSPEDALAMLRAFGGRALLAPQFDVLLDGSAVEKVEGPSLLVLLEWGRQNLDELRRRVRLRVGVIGEGLPAVTLAGITPALGGPGPVTLVHEPREGFRLLLPDGGDALCDEVAAIISAARGLSPLLQKLRPLLDADHGRLVVADAARQLGMSVRSLQRQLQAAGHSYRQEQQAARFRAVEELLASDGKLAAVAGQLGLTEAGLTRLVRAHSGLTPSELRRRLR